MILNNICPFCGKSTAIWKSMKTGYAIHGRGKNAVKQMFHNTCFDQYILNQKIRKEKEKSV